MNQVKTMFITADDRIIESCQKVLGTHSLQGIFCDREASALSSSKTMPQNTAHSYPQKKAYLPCRNEMATLQQRWHNLLRNETDYNMKS